MNYTISEKIQLASGYYINKVRQTFRDLKTDDPKAWSPSLWNLYGALQTNSGINVTPDTALNLASVYSAINIISGTISTLPIHLYKKSSQKNRKLIPGHPSLSVLSYRANELVPAINFREAGTAHLLSWGNMYAEIEREKNTGKIIALWLITPDRVTPIWRNGTISYKINIGSKDIYIGRDSILHIAGLGYDGVSGYSVITKAAESIGLSLGAEKFGAKYFGSNTNIGGALRFPRSMGKDAYKNLKKSLEEYTGSAHSHRWMILEQGMEIEKLGFSPDDSQFLQTRQFQVSEVARWFNIPPHKLKDLTRSTFSNIEEQEIEFVVSCIRPWLEKIEQNYNIQLLSEKETDQGYYFKHSVEGLLRGASSARAEYYTKIFYLGGLTPNEIRALEDMPLLDNENADKTYIQMNLMPLEDIDKALEPIPPIAADSDDDLDDDLDDDQRVLRWSKEQVKLIEYRSIVARDRITKRYYKLIEESSAAVVWKEASLIGKKFNGNAADIERIYSGFDKYIVKRIGPTFTAFAESIYHQALLEIGESLENSNEELKSSVDEYISAYAKRHIGSSKGQMIKIIEQSENTLTEQVNERIAEWKDVRPARIARNESVRLSSFAAQVGFFEFGYKTYWRIRGAKTCPYCTALSGKSIKSGQNFFQGGEEYKPKGADSAFLIRGSVMHPPLHQACDCYISAR